MGPLPVELVCAILGITGAPSLGARVCWEWNNYVESTATYRLILQEMHGFVQKHPLETQIRELIPHVTHFEECDIPPDLSGLKQKLKQIFHELELLLKKSGWNENHFTVTLSACHSLVDRFKEIIGKLELQGLMALSEAVQPWFPSAFKKLSLHGSVEGQIEKIKAWFKTLPTTSVKNMKVDFKKRKISLLSPAVLQTLPVMTLVLSHACHQAIPRFAYELKNLSYLCVDGNPIDSLDLTSFGQLQYLDARKTNISINNRALEIVVYK